MIAMPKNDYAAAGVNIAEAKHALEKIKDVITATYTPEVLSGPHSFSGLFDAFGLSRDYTHPVLAASTDGVGTKTKVAARLNRWDTIGRDIVNHCINDILVQGAAPLFFLDYIAAASLDAESVLALVSGVALACREAGCVLIGGETAEMPGVYEPGAVDLVGTIIGIADRDMLLNGDAIKPGDLLLALPGNGLHTNGFSLARTILDDHDWNTIHPDLQQSIGDALLAIHPSYLEPIQALRQAVEVHGLAHITGGGVYDNLSRILPGHLGASIERGTWIEPPIFALIQKLGAVDSHEMFHVFNMGLGMIAMIAHDDIQTALSILNGRANVIGRVVEHHNDVVVCMP